MTGDNQDVLEFLNQTKSMYDEDSANYRMCEQAIAAVMGVQKAAKKLAYIHQCIDLYCDREELHDESYWLDYLLDSDWADSDIGWDGNEEKPTRQPEPLTDKEQRIFLSAMSREEKVCKEVDEECRNCREPYEDSLVKTCHEIIRKVKGALWT